MKYLHTMIRVRDLDASLRFFCDGLGLRETRRMENTAGRYTLAKMGMSFVTLGLAAELADSGIAINALWPRTIIATDALNMIPGVEIPRCRTPQIVADAAHAVLVREARGFHGRFLIDEDVLREAGVSDFDGYAVDPSKPLLPDLFLD